MKKFLWFILASFQITIHHAQSKKIWLEMGNKAYEKGDYLNAARYYEKVLDDSTILTTAVYPYESQIINLKMKSLFKVPELSLTKKDTSKSVADNPEPKQTAQATQYDLILYKIATSYRLNYDYHHAVKYYKLCSERNVFPESKYYLGLMLMSVRRYQEALQVLDDFEKTPELSDSMKKEVTKKMAYCFFALDSMRPKKKVIVKKMDTLVFNRGTSNFAPQYYLSPQKLIFTSARKGGVVSDPDKQDSKYYCDLYYTTLDDTVWQRPVNFGRPVNTSLHEGSGVFTPDGVMLFTRWSDNNRKEAFIYMARSLDGKFYEAMKLGNGINMPNCKSQNPFVTMDGKKMFFSSNRPGGMGGFDIWVADIDENGFVGTPRNLGPPVNTPGNEISPYFHTLSSILYFSSDGHVGLGGLDIFKSVYNPDDSTYSQPVNLDAPINSSKDDAYFIMDKLQPKGFFASDREDCPDGHCYDIYSYEMEPIKLDIDGYVFDAQTNEPIPNALVTIKEVHENDETIYVTTDDKGYYSADLKPYMEYFMKAQKNKYFGDAYSLSTIGISESKHFEQDFFLNKIPPGEIVIEGIEYDFDKATLRPKSMEVLDKIVKLLEINDNIKIELSSHTDTRGSDEYNMRLSKARAQSCVDYIISKGISRDRIIAQGYGETRPLVPDSEINKLKPKSPEWEAAHQRNRRTAFRVIGETEIKIINKSS